jgi:hypothetical protein
MSICEQAPNIHIYLYICTASFFAQKIAPLHSVFLCKGRIKSAVPPIFLSKSLRHSTCLTRTNGSDYFAFTQTAPVGNSIHHLNLRKLSAGDFLSLIENDALLCTFIAFVICMYDTRFIVSCQEKSYSNTKTPPKKGVSE